MKKKDSWERWNKNFGTKRTAERQCGTTEGTSQRDYVEREEE